MKLDDLHNAEENLTSVIEDLPSIIKQIKEVAADWPEAGISLVSVSRIFGGELGELRRLKEVLGDHIAEEQRRVNNAAHNISTD